MARTNSEIRPGAGLNFACESLGADGRNDARENMSQYAVRKPCAKFLQRGADPLRPPPGLKRAATHLRYCRRFSQEASSSSRSLCSSGSRGGLGRQLVQQIFFKGRQRRALFARKRIVIQQLVDFAKLLHALAKTLRRAAGRGSGIVQFVSQSGGKFAERAQLVALLFRPAVFSNSIGQHADQAGQQFRNALEHFLKVIFVQTQNPGWARWRGRSSGSGSCGRTAAGRSPARPVPQSLGHPSPPLSRASANFAFQQNEQRIRRIAFVQTERPRRRT